MLSRVVYETGLTSPYLQTVTLADALLNVYVVFTFVAGAECHHMAFLCTPWNLAGRVAESTDVASHGACAVVESFVVVLTPACNQRFVLLVGKKHQGLQYMQLIILTG